MRFSSVCGTLILLGLVAMGSSLQAHHSFAMFEMDKSVNYAGTILEYRWINPHTHIIVKIDAGPDVDPATVGTWDVEGGSTNIMGRQGWTRATYKAGDKIALVGHPMRDGSKGISLFYAVRDGKKLFHDIARPKGENGAN